MSARIKRILERAITVSRDELETIYIIQGRPISDVINILGVLKPKVVNISEKDNELGIYIPPRPMHEVPPLAHIAQPLGIEVNVYFYDINGIPIYFIDEPTIDSTGIKFYAYLRQRVGEMGITKPGELVSLARDLLDDIGVDPRIALNESSVKAAIYYVFRDMIGYGPIEIPMEDTYVEEVSWFAYDGPIEVVDKKVADVYPNAEFIPTNVFFEIDLPDISKKFFMTQVVRAITAKARVGLTTAKPLAEARIPDPTGRGFHRLAAHLDITSRSPAVTIRKFPQKKLSLTELLRYGTLSSLEAAYLLWQLVNRGFILIVGGMASGKTTLLQALISALPVMYKVVTVEDTPELSTPAQNWHPLYVRRAPKESELEDINFSRLVIHSLRHRGTIVTLGEVRGAEMADLIQAAASGHGAICLPPDTPVLARFEGEDEPQVVGIKEVVEAYEDGKEVYVYSFDPKTGRYDWRPVTASIRVMTDLWYIIETETGRRLKMTPDHRLLVYNPVTDSFDVIEAKDVRIGDLIPVATRAPRGKLKYKIECCNVFLSLTANLARIFGHVLLHGHNKVEYRLPGEAAEWLKSVPLKMSYRRKGDIILVKSVNLHRLVNRLLDHILRNPLSLPQHFVDALANVLKNNSIELPSKKHAEALHYAFKAWGWDSVVNDNTLFVLEKVDKPYKLEKVIKVETQQAVYDDAYDIEVDEYHTFITGDSIITSNCTFHAHDPDSVLARITSPPINAAPESLKLITAIVHIARTKTYARGRPESVRRVLRVFEIEDVKGKEVKATETFKWNPITDVHYPPLTTEGLKELWRRSNTVRTFSYNLYVDEAPRALVELYVIARYLDYLTKQGVFDIKEVTFRMTTLYLRLDSIVDKLWKERFKKELMPLMEEV